MTFVIDQRAAKEVSLSPERYPFVSLLQGDMYEEDNLLDRLEIIVRRQDYVEAERTFHSAYILHLVELDEHPDMEKEDACSFGRYQATKMQFFSMLDNLSENDKELVETEAKKRGGANALDTVMRSCEGYRESWIKGKLHHKKSFVDHELNKRFGGAR